MSGIGESALRREDESLLRGRGRFIDDVERPGQLHAWFVRSPYAHARLGPIDTAMAESAPGVAAVFTGAALVRDGVGRMEPSSTLRGRDGATLRPPPWPAMALDTARYVGDTVAMVVAQTHHAAREAAELIDIDYEILDHVTDLRAACEPGAAELRSEYPGNVALEWAGGDAEATERAFAAAARVVAVELVQNRLSVAALETRGVLAEFDAGSARFVVHTPTQGGWTVQQALARSLKVDSDAVRVITPDVGGAFGIKAWLYPEQVLCALAARSLGRPVKWYADRSDSFLADYHARDHVMKGELAVDERGRFLAIRSTAWSNMGAYLTASGPVIPTTGGTRLLSNVYRIGAFHASTRLVLTNTAPIGAYRGAGKPEYLQLVELLVDEAARQLAMEPVELRRLNMITPAELPYRTPQGMRYDSGDFAEAMDTALRLAGGADLDGRRAEARSRGRRLGFGVAVYTEPDGFMDNRVRMGFDAEGALEVSTTAQTGGQGYETVFSQVAGTLLGLPMEAVRIVQGDTDRSGAGGGAGGSRVTTVTGTAMHRCAEEIIAKGRAIAAHLLQADAAEIAFEEGRFRVEGSERAIDIREIARAAHDAAELPPGTAPELRAESHFTAEAYCYPSGCHVCEVEIDVDTGDIEIVRYVQVSDFGTVVNPMLLEGQVHGGIAQGIGQVLYEQAVYDADSGQLLSGSFMDYCLPRATHLPSYRCERLETPCLTNPLGVKGCGESGTTGSLPAVANAVHDALSDCDLRGFDMPFTPEKVWRVLAKAAVPSS